jgi:preprotein translocase subunit SecG
MGKLVFVLFLFLCVAIIMVILTQHRKSGGFAGSFGGGGTQMDIPGSWQRMPTVTKITFGLTALFMLMSLVMIKLKL